MILVQFARQRSLASHINHHRPIHPKSLQPSALHLEIHYSTVRPGNQCHQCSNCALLSKYLAVQKGIPTIFGACYWLFYHFHFVEDLMGRLCVKRGIGYVGLMEW